VSIDLSGNDISEEGAKKLETCLAMNATLLQLRLHGT